ncbi:Xaa-Pro peptidase family protein [Pollutibacter soli]|uniref:Xaa-Pro peptidase family protein n=1 Tax=Pollutibacter soli TaxID=3034157 RepID=UPI00301376C6
MISRFCLFIFACINLTIAFAQDIPLFTSEFTIKEFADRRSRIYDSIGSNAIALIQGAPSPVGYVKFRQSNEFYYLCGIEVPHAYLLLNGSSRTATLYLPHRNAGRERGEGKMLSAEDIDLIKQLSGIDNVYGVDLLSEHLGRFSSGSIHSVYTLFEPAEGFAVSRDLGIRVNADAMGDPWDQRQSHETRFIEMIKNRFPKFEIKNLNPILDKMRLIKSPAEIMLIKKATRLSALALMEAMRSTEPGIKEYELDGMAKYIYYRNGSQGDAYYSLIASAENAYYPHYHEGKRTLKDGDLLLMDYAPDYGYYMSDVTRMMPANGKFNTWQKELYGFYLICYKAILKNIKPGLTPQNIKKQAVIEMEQALKTSKFSKPIHENAAKAFVESYRKSAENPKSPLGHWVGMATHDVGGYDGGPLLPGMVFTIEPALTVPEEKIYIRLEDMIIITETGADIITSYLPMEIADIEKLMKEEGMLQKYPRDKE